MRRSTKILGVIAVVFLGLGGYGVYHASGRGSRDIVDGKVVELKEHTGTRPICVVNGRKSTGCLTLNATEPYSYATEVAGGVALLAFVVFVAALRRPIVRGRSDHCDGYRAHANGGGT